MSITTESGSGAIAADLAAFVHESPSSYHAAATARSRLLAAGFSELDERQSWELAAGGRYLVIRDGAILAWVMPEQPTAAPGFRVLGAHTDSPAFKLKPNPGFTAEGSLQVGVEIYGGPLLNSWLDRELRFAGRLVTSEGRTVLAQTPAIGRIPQLAIHLDRQVNEKLALDRQRHMQPVIGLENIAGPSAVLEVLAASAGVDAADVVGFDVVTIAAQAPDLFGIHDEFLASARLDNLSSVHAGVAALALIDPVGLREIPLLAAFDHEEVGSESRSGAAGPFLADVTERIVGSLGTDSSAGRSAGPSTRPAAGSREAFLQSMAKSICFSSDAGHGVHPNYPERHDPVNRPRLGGGPLLKINAQQRYSTDAVGTAAWARACATAGVRYQEFVSNNAMPCGSTIGPLTATRLGMTTVDVGIALWSMHSAREMCAASDVADLFRVAHAFFAGR
ncbi:M18 family aminopeptidase [Brevibacterium daeguense]|uniref:M18 family aminopeptidase n=1 Tax=Brevibacterium daeguense TaxID=909936 RepID=A0ABP8EK50_9MICO|nr:M18 family aminopeptidase [Brevibacterium daeguense]